MFVEGGGGGGSIREGGEGEGSDVHSSELGSNSPMTGSPGTGTLLGRKYLSIPPALLFPNTCETKPKHSHGLSQRRAAMGKHHCLLVDTALRNGIWRIWGGVIFLNISRQISKNIGQNAQHTSGAAERVSDIQV